ncbi:gluconokinase [Herbiconiux ginsengi]|uniref:Gluconokinase n=1 Tax=Herbiconiux ginsengi TaxID=381665 RepID=A0A1H3LND8_9MICO|nr:gluconokinase [Herbiconiux ginsengi]SDY66057.1 gluconate kinase, SKI family [Herbiconiux ginsengi]
MVGSVAGDARLRQRVIVVSGVAGSGKSTVGTLLASRLGQPFIDADDLHPRSNVTKMSAGTPLTDDDRRPWLDAVGRAARESTAVVACSALRRIYRSQLRHWVPDAVFVQLTAQPELVGARLATRADHFMPASLLASQYALLEPLTPDEGGLTLDVASRPESLVEHIVSHLAHADDDGEAPATQQPLKKERE